jgi:hypothetical protein
MVTVVWWIQWHWDRFFSEFFDFPLSYYSTAALSSHVTWMMKNMSVGGSSSETPINTNYSSSKVLLLF